MNIVHFRENLRNEIISWIGLMRVGSVTSFAILDSFNELFDFINLFYHSFYAFVKLPELIIFL